MKIKKIKLIKMEDPYPIKPGSKGIVNYIDDLGQIHVNWENGSTLAVIPGIDKYIFLNEK